MKKLILSYISPISIVFLLCLGIANSAHASQYDPSFPDAIYCDISSTAGGTNDFVLLTYAYRDGGSVINALDVNDARVYSSNDATDIGSRSLEYYPDGTFSSATGYFVGSNCDGKSISDLYTDNQAFDFGGSGTTTINQYFSSSTGSTSSSTSIDSPSFDMWMIYWSFFSMVCFVVWLGRSKKS